MIAAKMFRKEEGGEWIMLAAVSGRRFREIDILDMVHCYQQQDFKRGVIAFYSVQLLRSRRLEYTIPCWYESITSVSMN